jgi:hypothetical protein
MRKGIRGVETLAEAIAAAARASEDGLALIETDRRAHCNPTRMASIRRLSFKLLRRIVQACPACGSPGWGVNGRTPGLPCSWCGLPTALTHWMELGCAACNHSERQPRADGLLQADAGHCQHCNP